MDEKETRPWEPYIPTYVGMYYVDYRDDLSDNTKLLQDCIDKNSLYPISEYLDDWWEYPEAPYLEEMQNQMERDGIEWDDDWVDEIRDALWAKDTSDPINDLLRNTGAITMFYSLGVEIDGWHSAFLCNPWPSYVMLRMVVNFVSILRPIFEKFCLVNMKNMIKISNPYTSKELWRWLYMITIRVLATTKNLKLTENSHSSVRIWLYPILKNTA